MITFTTVALIFATQARPSHTAYHFITTHSSLSRSALENPQLLQDEKWLQQNSLVYVPFKFPFVCDRELVEHSSWNKLTFLQQMTRLNGTKRVNLADLSTSDRAQLLSLLKRSPFASRMKNLAESTSLDLEFTPIVQASIKTPNRIVPVPGRVPESTDRPKSIPNALKAKPGETKLLGEPSPLIAIDVHHSAPSAIPVFQMMLAEISRLREESRKKLDEESGRAAMNWIQSILGSSDDLSKSHSFSDLSPELQKALEAPFLHRSAENGFASKEQASHP
jgi:hypothetical protein